MELAETVGATAESPVKPRDKKRTKKGGGDGEDNYTTEISTDPLEGDRREQ